MTIRNFLEGIRETVNEVLDDRHLHPDVRRQLAMEARNATEHMPPEDDVFIYGFGLCMDNDRIICSERLLNECRLAAMKMLSNSAPAFNDWSQLNVIGLSKSAYNYISTGVIMRREQLTERNATADHRGFDTVLCLQNEPAYSNRTLQARKRAKDLAAKEAAADLERRRQVERNGGGGPALYDVGTRSFR